MSRFVMISLNDRGNLGARQLVARAKHLGHDAFLINYGEYHHDKYTFSEKADDVPGPSSQRLQQLVTQLHPDIIGISYRSTMAKLARALASIIYKHNIPLVAGGIGATSDPDDALQWADAVCVGEGDFVIEPLLAGEPLEGIPNLKTPTPNPQPPIPFPLLADLDDAPFPDYTAETTWTIVNGKVTHPDGRLDNDIGAYPILTSRGCPRACTYCHNSTVHALYKGQRYARQRSVENVMAEIAWAWKRWKFKLLSVYDDLFIADPDWCFEFARRLPDAWPGRRRFWCMTHPIYIREDVLRALIEVGLEEVCLGVQSGSDRILKLYRRGTSRAEILNACGILAYLPVAVKIDIISANPLERPKDELATMDLLQNMPRNDRWHSGLSRLTIFPGSEIGTQVTQAQCDALHNERQDFVDGLYRAAFQPRWRKLDLVAAMRRYDDFQRFKDARYWPETDGELSEHQWMPLTAWLDKGLPTK